MEKTPFGYVFQIISVRNSYNKWESTTNHTLSEGERSNKVKEREGEREREREREERMIVFLQTYNFNVLHTFLHWLITTGSLSHSSNKRLCYIPA